MSTGIVVGSLGAIAKRDNVSIAESFANAECIVIVDTSGSMNTYDNLTMTRYERACNELKALQNNLPGKIAVLAFSDTVVFCPSGVPQQFHGGTNLAGALQFAKVGDVAGMKFILISDGEPDDEKAALNVARTFKAKIDVIYVGPEAAPRGREFLERLAKSMGGRTVTADRAVNLLDAAKTLLLEA